MIAKFQPVPLAVYKKISCSHPQFCSRTRRSVLSRRRRRGITSGFPRATPSQNTHHLFLSPVRHGGPARSGGAPLFSYSYESPFPQFLYFDNDPNRPGCGGKPCHSGSELCGSGPASGRRVSVANPVLSYFCKLFVVDKKVKSFAINQIRTLLQNTGGGVPQGTSRSQCDFHISSFQFSYRGDASKWRPIESA